MSLQSECNKNQCSICAKNVRNNSKAVQCDICDLWVHASCEQISKKRYNELSDSENEEVFFCSKCLNNELPFGLQNDIIFEQTNTLGLNSDSNLENLAVNLSKDDTKAINNISKLILENNDSTMNNDKNQFCRYYSIDKFISSNFQKQRPFSIFHLNIHSLQFHKNDLDVLLDSLNVKFDVITISETLLQKNSLPTKDITLDNYEIESTPTEAAKGGTLIYISKKLNHKPRKDLEIYIKKKRLNQHL